MMRKGGQHFMNSALRLRLCYFLPAFYLVTACTGSEEQQKVARGRTAAPPVDGRLFTLLPSSYTGVRFENRVHFTPETNVFTSRNFYKCAGAGAGDLKGRGLPPR